MVTHRNLALGAGLLIALVGLSAQGLSQSKVGESSKPKAEPPKKHAEHGLTENTTPGPAHAMLAKYAGQWETSSTFSAPGMTEGDPVKGSAKITSMLGGRFFMEQNNGEMMGQPVESIHYVGYNNSTKEYEANWTWTMDTGMLQMKGTSSDGGKTINWKGSFKDETGNDQNLIAVSKYPDADHFSLELRGEGPEDAAVMKTSYTRKK